jgi:hypothetical protein
MPSLRSRTIPSAAIRRASAWCASTSNVPPFGRLLRPEDDAQDPAHRLVEHAFVELARPDRLDDRLDPAVLGPRHLPVEAGRERRDAVAHGAPVGDDEALEAPLVLEDVAEEAAMLRGQRPVDLVVRAHHRPGPGLRDGLLEGRKVELAKGALVDLGVDGEALELLVVGGVVLQRGPDTVGLDALDHGHGHLAGEERVFREVLEAAAAERRALHVDAGAQHDVDLERDALFGHRAAHRPQERRVPRRGRARRGREARGGEAGGPRRVDVRHAPDAVRTIRDDHRGDAEALDRCGRPAACAGAQGRLLLERHPRDDGRDVRGHGSLASDGAGSCSHSPE